MADVDMTDAPVPAPKVAKASKSEGADKKPRFEVKKVSRSTPPQAARFRIHFRQAGLKDLAVERRRTLGLGYRRRQLRHLP